MWQFAHCDPYGSVAFDLLHRIDIGAWGKHILPELQDLLKTLRVLRPVNVNLDSIPVWPGLSHFDGVNRSISKVTEFADGNTMRDLLKVRMDWM
jgi:hypothetical protein